MELRERFKEMSAEELVEQIDYFGCDPYYIEAWRPMKDEIAERLAREEKIVHCKDCTKAEPRRPVDAKSGEIRNDRYCPVIRGYLSRFPEDFHCGCGERRKDG